MGSTTTDLALYLKYTSIPTKDPSVNQNKPDSDHQSSRWFSPSIFSTQLLPLRPASTSLRTLSLPQDPSSWMSSAPAASPSPPSSHAQTVVICAGCSTVLCQPTGGKARLTEGCSFRRK